MHSTILFVSTWSLFLALPFPFVHPDTLGTSDLRRYRHRLSATFIEPFTRRTFPLSVLLEAVFSPWVYGLLQRGVRCLPLRRVTCWNRSGVLRPETLWTSENGSFRDGRYVTMVPTIFQGVYRSQEGPTATGNRWNSRELFCLRRPCSLGTMCHQGAQKTCLYFLFHFVDTRGFEGISESNRDRMLLLPKLCPNATFVFWNMNDLILLMEQFPFLKEVKAMFYDDRHPVFFNDMSRVLIMYAFGVMYEYHLDHSKGMEYDGVGVLPSLSFFHPEEMFELERMRPFPKNRTVVSCLMSVSWKVNSDVDPMNAQLTQILLFVMKAESELGVPGPVTAVVLVSIQPLLLAWVSGFILFVVLRVVKCAFTASLQFEALEYLNERRIHS